MINVMMSVRVDFPLKNHMGMIFLNNHFTFFFSFFSFHFLGGKTIFSLDPGVKAGSNL